MGADHKTDQRPFYSNPKFLYSTLIFTAVVAITGSLASKEGWIPLSFSPTGTTETPPSPTAVLPNSKTTAPPKEVWDLLISFSDHEDTMDDWRKLQESLGRRVFIRNWDQEPLIISHNDGSRVRTTPWTLNDRNVAGQLPSGHFNTNLTIETGDGSEIWAAVRTLDLRTPGMMALVHEGQRYADFQFPAAPVRTYLWNGPRDLVDVSYFPSERFPANPS